METWTELLINRLEVAYSNRFDPQAALIFLNDAYQEYLLMRKNEETTSEEIHFAHDFMQIRDLFICQLVDRYPSNYAEVEQKINELKRISIHTQQLQQEKAHSTYLQPSF